MELYDFSYNSLEKYSYRNLQQVAKSLGLPSNVKKMYLIEMILTKKHCTEEQLNAIVSRVKMERKKIQSQNKKNKKKGKRVQGNEISSTSQQHVNNQPTHSPPISGTPRRRFLLQCTPDVTITKMQPKKSILKPLEPKSKESDRILRSFNSKKTNFGIIECKDTLIKIVKAQNPVQVTQEIRSSNTVERSVVPFKLSVGKNVQRRVLNAKLCLKKLDTRIVNQHHTQLNRQPTVSGIYPLKPSENTYYEYIPTVGFRHNDGKVSKINAMVKKPKNILQYNRPIKVTMQEVINRKVDNTIREYPKPRAIDYKPPDVLQEDPIPAIDYKPQTIDSDVTTTLTRPVLNTLNNNGANTLQTYKENTTTTMTNTTENTQIKPSNTLENPTFGVNTYTNVSIKDLNSDYEDYTVYCHKKIRRVNEREVLPRINEVFSQFNEVQYRSLTQPLYVQVGQESERFPQHPYPLNNENTSMLETLYNFKLQFIINQPLLKIATTSNTRCVFSTTTVPTAVAHPPPAYNEYNNNNTFERVNQYNYNLEADTRLYDYMRLPEQGSYKRDFTCDEVLSPASSQGTTNSQELGTNASIPEMVEDALELISQDGDYMERLGLDIRMQCILCDWAGSKIILEYHVKQTHQKEILYKNSSDWTIVLTLGALVSHEIWLSKVVQYNEYLYVVSTKYSEDCISVILTTLSEATTPKNGQITIYNKITGQPYTWQGEILPIPDTLPFTTSFSCLKQDITSLDLLPNSANLKLINKELKLVSDNKVVVGQPSLNDIDIVIHINVCD